MRLALPAAVIAAMVAMTPNPLPAQPKAAKTGPAFDQAPFGKMPDGTAVTGYTLVNRNGVTIHAIEYGGIITSIRVPDKDGKLADVALGFDTLEGYLKGHPYFGANAGRSANRIAKGKFSIDGKQYT